MGLNRKLKRAAAKKAAKEQKAKKAENSPMPHIHGPDCNH